MKHFIMLRVNLIYYYYNNKLNSIGDCSYNYHNYYYDNGIGRKYRVYRGRFVYSKKPHYEDSKGIKEWYYSDKTYSNYEAYMMAVIG